MSRLSLSFALAAAMAVPAQAADTWVVDPSHSEASFRIRHLVSNVAGRFNEFTGTIHVDQENPSASSVSFEIEAASIDTGNEQRDGHLRSADFFDVEKHPQISFESTSVEPRGDDLYHVTGNLTMHGVTKQVTLPVRYLGSMTGMGGRKTAGFEIETTLDRKDYGIEWNRVLDEGGVVLGDEVRVRIAIEAGPPQEPQG
jgi:polyisoprenoid-binding protein YceI